MAKGWYRESRRHSLASQGIKTAQKMNPILRNAEKLISKQTISINKFAQELKPDGDRIFMFRIWDEDYETGRRLNLGVFPIRANNKSEAMMKALPRLAPLRRVGGLRVVVDVKEVTK